MKLLLTSNGIAHPSIHDALVDLLGKPIVESSALFVLTGIYPFPGSGERAWEHRTWAAGVPVPTYAIDDETALKVSGGTVEVVSEGHWRLFAPAASSD
jgi:hypothetical protein